MNTATARAWLQNQVFPVLGAGFHWDTPAADYVNADGSPVFSAAAAAGFDLLADDAYNALTAEGLDPYRVALDMLDMAGLS